jgi:hypothetical protein
MRNKYIKFYQIIIINIVLRYELTKVFPLLTLRSFG